MRPLPVCILLANALLVGSSFAAEAPAPQPAAPAETKSETPAAKAGEKGAEKPAEEAAAEAKAKAGAEKSAADQKPSPQRFIPSEQVRADFDVSFPIDI